ncbi:hypothetical protein Pmani_013668 [Petrolisthes manimaculis]|uniref:Uncharacterized protein n=1 Tax=Petrolisthes manimaculis TaxID=1843537 RepID=A0AAE1PX25_9EUCA|nr:hypothetical protein Pmani_013668 [Petrolisthes manimaculis]
MDKLFSGPAVQDVAPLTSCAWRGTVLAPSLSACTTTTAAVVVLPASLTAAPLLYLPHCCIPTLPVSLTVVPLPPTHLTCLTVAALPHFPHLQHLALPPSLLHVRHTSLKAKRLPHLNHCSLFLPADTFSLQPIKFTSLSALCLYYISHHITSHQNISPVSVSGWEHFHAGFWQRRLSFLSVCFELNMYRTGHPNA